MPSLPSARRSPRPNRASPGWPPLGRASARPTPGGRIASVERARRRGGSGATSSRQVGRGQMAADARRMALDREVDRAEADIGKAEARFGWHRREEADRGEARDRVDFGQEDVIAAD